MINGKNIVVTGASSGIGKSILEELLEQGDNRILAACRRAEMIADYGDRVIPFSCDLSTKEGVDAVFGAHVSPELPLSHAGVRYGKFYAASDTFRVVVHGNEPDWNVNPGDYESSMNIVGQIYLDDLVCGNPLSRVAAFVDGKCCGVASPKLMASRDAWFVSMTVYGLQDVTKEQPVTFRVYDAEHPPDSPA